MLASRREKKHSPRRYDSDEASLTGSELNNCASRKSSSVLLSRLLPGNFDGEGRNAGRAKVRLTILFYVTLLRISYALNCPGTLNACLCENLSEAGDKLKLDCSGVSVEDAKSVLQEISEDENVTWDFLATNCSWTELPDGFFGNHRIERIDIYECGLEKISEAALRSTSQYLRDIRFMSNNLVSFPFELEMPNLDTLILYDNKFDRFPRLQYPNLRLLFLGGNLFEELPEDAFRSVPQLQDLYLGGNVLRTMPASALATLKHLRILACESGYMRNLVAGSLEFAEEAQVDYLILHYNEITEIDVNALTPGRFPKEKFLLNNNNLTVLPQNLFKPMLQSFITAGKGSLSVAENPLHCCAHLWLFRDRRYFRWFEDLTSTTCTIGDETIQFTEVKYRKLRADCARLRRSNPRARGSSSNQDNDDDAE
ncbi:unnamed protein product [Notodromas monacha]|uniref:Uncharacterized protein n=1 Tax=Notodromas monacha TaxID=399045 RepID=A0A7R9BT31_9CRUS|nr:unnamed protein product [Notodromas monacha]CAG0919851.1 unnamed protein product [Notodromas monacha]